MPFSLATCPPCCSPLTPLGDSTMKRLTLNAFGSIVTVGTAFVSSNVLFVCNQLAMPTYWHL